MFQWAQEPARLHEIADLRFSAAKNSSPVKGCDGSCLPVPGHQLPRCSFPVLVSLCESDKGPDGKRLDAGGVRPGMPAGV